jgi:undecaprenyl-diphosphatase
VQYLLLAVIVPVLCTEVLKWVIGRGRPFVGGTADPFNFAPFNGTEAYFSLPSAHAVTAFALAFAVAALWPRLRVVMYLYAIAIGLSRLVLLAHHPSDVVAGALVGIIGALAVRYWFASRRLGFAIRSRGRIVPR